MAWTAFVTENLIGGSFRGRAVLIIVKPDTVVGRHRKGFRLLWTWKSRQRRGGRPVVPRASP